nr:hypothetical protein [Gemmatimonadaceae bacterium]MCU0625740.1 hypothetical protein [Gemmatimonadaceae bacterium]
MIAIGLGWLILGKSSRAQDRDDRYDYSGDDYTAFDAPRAAQRPGFAALPAGSVGARTGEYYGAAQQGDDLDDMGHGMSARDQYAGSSSSRGMTDDVRERASQAADRVRSIADTATSRAKEFTESASHRARDLA